MEEILMLCFGIGSPLTIVAFKYPVKYEQISWPILAVLFCVLCFIWGFSFGHQGAYQDIWNAYNEHKSSGAEPIVGEGVSFSLKAISSGVPFWFTILLALAMVYIALLPSIVKFFKS